MKPLIENSPVSGYDDLVALWWAFFYCLSVAIGLGAFVFGQIAEKMRAKNVRKVSESHQN